MLQIMDRKTVNAQLREQFFPLLTAVGFARAGDVLRRELPGPVVHVVEVQHLPRRGVFQVNLGAHLPALREFTDRPPLAAADTREPDCAWRGSLISGFRNSSDAEFAYGTTVEETAESVAFLASEWERQSTRFFDPVTHFPAGFHVRAHQVAEENLHPAHLLVWARVADLLQDRALSDRLAELGLERAPERATTLRGDLTQLLERPYASK